MKTTFLRVLDELQQRVPFFVHQTPTLLIRARKSDIFYFECADKTVRMVTRKGEEQFRMVFEKLLEQLADDSDFIATHRSFIANLKNVETFSGEKLFFPNGDAVPISTRRIKEVKRALLRCVRRHSFPSAYESSQVEETENG